MKPYQDLTPKAKIFRMTLARIIIYGVLLLALYFACARLYRTINEVKTPVTRDKRLPVAFSEFFNINLPIIFHQHSSFNPFTCTRTIRNELSAGVENILVI